MALFQLYRALLIAVEILRFVSAQAFEFSLLALSYLFELHLRWKYPIYSVCGKTRIPSCPYVWPNGQGDSAKFLHGEANSRQWRRQYGPVYQIWSGTSPEVVITDPDDVKSFMYDSSNHIKATDNHSGWIMRELLGQCLGLISGSDWQRVRRSMSSPFLPASMDRYIAAISDLTQAHFDMLNTGARMQAGLLNPTEDLRLLPFSIVANVLYGILPIDMEKRLIQLIGMREALWNRMLKGGLARFEFGRWIISSVTKDLRSYKMAWATLNSDICRLRQLEGIDAPILAMWESAQRGDISHEELYQTLDEMLFANLDVALGGISWNLLFLGNHRGIQEELRHEISRARINNDARKWTEYLRNSSTLLAACISESSRLKPLAAFTVGQAAPSSRLIGGFVVPAGTVCIVDTHALNMSETFWGPDVETYNPRRFFAKAAVDLRYRFWRYGFGPRQCLGRHLADIMIRALLAHVVGHYTISMPNAACWARDPKNWIVHPDTVVGLHPVE